MDPRAAPPEAELDALFASLYQELHRLADGQRRRAGADLTVGTTTLVHEAYLAMSDNAGLRFSDRSSFVAYVARAVRGLIIDHARKALARKRGGGACEVPLDEGTTPAVEMTPDPDAVSRLSDSLDDLLHDAPALAELVDLHVFGGFSLAEIAGTRGVSERTVQREWRRARMLLQQAYVQRLP